ncbi:putative transcription factor interactor and regulator CCHC(Zn) family [Helianthus annuus]|nr:putative transcription factor interactor and regulator CCHC(Zn) family [Helianthus annuus]
MSDTSSETINTSMTIDSSNPLYLHPSDHPGMILVSKSFDGTGFGAWKRAMTIALSAKNKLGFVTGHLSREIGASVLYVESAHQLWMELNDRYGQVNGAKFYQLQKNLCEIVQGNCDVATYFTKLKTNWDELNAINVIPPCTCATAHLIAKRDEDQRLMQFLMGLNSCYDTVRGNILMMQPLPSLNQAYSLVIQDEKQREIHAASMFHSESASMNVSSQIHSTQYSRYDNKKSIICSNCKKNGHHASKCYRLIGFPKDFKFTKSRRGAANMVGDEKDLSNQEFTNPFLSNDLQENAPTGPSITVQQYNELMQLLQRTQLNKESNAQPTTSLSYANFAGPFNEEATGSW